MVVPIHKQKREDNYNESNIRLLASAFRVRLKALFRLGFVRPRSILSAARYTNRTPEKQIVILVVFWLNSRSRGVLGLVLFLRSLLGVKV
jgi:hypothetical protein